MLVRHPPVHNPLHALQVAGFSEEVVRGGAAAPLSQLLALLEPWWVYGGTGRVDVRRLVCSTLRWARPMSTSNHSEPTQRTCLPSAFTKLAALWCVP